MENKNKNLDYADVLLDRAVADLRQTPIPPGPSSETIEQVLQTLTQTPGNAFLFWRKGIALAALLAAGILAWIAWNASPAQSIAFADIRRQVLAAQTVTYLNTTSWYRKGKPDPASLTAQVMILAPNRERTVYPTGQITIFDYQQGKGLELYPSMRKATQVNIPNLPKEIIHRNLFALFQEFPEGWAQDVGLQSLDGRNVRMFRITRNEMTYTVWTDLETALPVRIEYAFKAIDLLSNETIETKVVKSDIVFNSPLDPALFALTPPPGFILDSAERPWHPNRPVEEDVIQALHNYALSHQGSFPPVFNLKTLLDLSTQSTWEKIKTAHSAVNFVQLLRAQNQPWQYTGQNKKLNQPNTPIFQYQLKNCRRTLHADLTITESPPEQKMPD